MDFYAKMIALCCEKGVSRSKMADDIGISRSTPSDWEKKKSKPQPATLKKIADYFGVPITYFTEDSTDNKTIQDNHGIIGNAHAPVTIINGSQRQLTEQEIELLNIFETLNVMDQAKLLVYANELKESK